MRPITIVIAAILTLIVNLDASAQKLSVGKTELASIATVDSRTFNDRPNGIQELNREWNAIEKDFEVEINELKGMHDRLQDAHSDLKKCTEKPFCAQGRNFQAVLEFADELQKKANIKRFDLETKFKSASESRIRPIQTKIKSRLAEYATKLKVEVVIDLAEPENDGFSFLILRRKIPDLTRDFIDWYNSETRALKSQNRLRKRADFKTRLKSTQRASPNITRFDEVEQM